MKHFVLALALSSGVPFATNAAVIDNGVIRLGVDELGQLNVDGDVPSPVSGTTAVGLRYLPSGFEATSHGCLCEGWGVGIGETGQSGYANNSIGISGLTLVSFTSTASTAASIVSVNGTGLVVTHSFAPASETANLYRVNVKIENTGMIDISDLRYTRTFDWDIEPTTFNEYVTHAGVATTPSVLRADNNGFSDSNPFGSRSTIGAGGLGDFADLGPLDHGSNFDFGFGELKTGEAYTFDIFYGAAGSKASALAALGSVGAELYSLGQSVNAAGGPANDMTTFIFAFKGVGGDGNLCLRPLAPIPLPATAFMLLAGIGMMSSFRLRRKKL